MRFSRSRRFHTLQAIRAALDVSPVGCMSGIGIIASCMLHRHQRSGSRAQHTVRQQQKDEQNPSEYSKRRHERVAAPKIVYTT